MEMYGMLGERLGAMQSTKAQGGDKAGGREMPKWKTDILQKPSVSVRKGIAWGYAAPYEDTDTLVLTSTKSGFVDIRFPRKRELGQPIASDPSFWAFGGRSSTTFLEGDGIDMPYSAHCVWNHEIDSKGPGVSDEGDMFVLPNGDCMEVGVMQNLQTGKVEMYKEYWTSPDATGSPHLTPCIVAKAIPPPKDDGRQEASVQIGSGGVVIRIGGYCQGIMRQQWAKHKGHPAGDDTIWVERWTQGLVEANPSTPAAVVQAGTATSSGWVQDWRSNTPSDDGPSMPCAWVCDPGRTLGDETVVNGITWRIVEAVATDASKPTA